MAELADLHEFLVDLDDEQWRAPSLCNDWTVMEVAAHLASFVGVPVRGLAERMARSGFVPARANSRGVARWCELGRRSITEALRPARTPGVAKVYARVGLTELVIHHQDMRRPLGLHRVVPEARLRVALQVAARWPMGTGARRRQRLVELRATDMDWSLGDGPRVDGTGEALLMALAGRRSVLGELHGDGVPALSRTFDGG
ncbi:MAG: maleylpyruvate isomerase family mycothiol-dependent enzyme [Acidimicrobiia bacterium]|nr:maleylpyruvate isomerase family mycothiol-dependent enzyme [Acidimicrobiia bacterium]